MTKRLREEALEGYTPRISNSPFPDVHNTLGFFQHITAERGMTNMMILPMRLVQHLASLGQEGFEIAAGQKYDHEALTGLLDKIWHYFTLTLIRWVKGRKQTRIYNEQEDYYYGCFKVPDWFIEEAQESRVPGVQVEEEYRYIYIVNPAYLDH